MQAKNPIILIVGTRPEGIKMAPVYFALKQAGLPVLLCSTGQHTELLQDVLSLFNIKPDIHLDIMRHGQDLFYTTQSILQKCKDVFTHIQPSIVLVQGDTTSTMAAALAAFYLKIPVGHIEAGLRTYDMHAPFPEEANRQFVSAIATYHFAPTSFACANLMRQGIKQENIFCTGNTVVDALRIIREKILHGFITCTPEIQRHLIASEKLNQKIMLLTLHRRESFGGDILQSLHTIKTFLQEHSDVFCFYPYHPNPAVIDALNQIKFYELDNIYLCEPLKYQDLASVLIQSSWVITDSGGIQEEAVSLGKHTIILREKTERPEGVWAGLAHIAGTSPEKIKFFLDACYAQAHTNTLLPSNSIFGDGFAAEKICAILQTQSILVKNSVPYKNNVDTPFQEKKDNVMKKVCVVGLGYIGLPTAIVAAEHHMAVHGFDIDEERVKNINQGNPVIEEPEIFERLQIALQHNFKASIEVEESHFYIIAVPTPFLEDKRADLSYVFDAVSRIAPYIKHSSVVILESTVPVGTTQKIATFLEELTHLKAGIDFFVAHCPERVLPGLIFKELVENSRIIGGINKESVEQAASFYKIFVQGPLYLTDTTTAEMVKLIENSSRDVQIAFAHQVASMAEQAGLDPYKVIELANKHPRVQILNPTAGVGGHCIAIDPWFLVETFPEQTKLLHAARVANQERPFEIIKKIRHEAHAFKATHQRAAKILVLGLTYKADVDDMRESPALFIAQQLQQMSTLDLLVCEPHVQKTKLAVLFGSSIVSLQEGAALADIIVYLVAHKRFKAVDHKIMKTKKLLDFCGILHTPHNDNEQQREYTFWPARTNSDESIQSAPTITYQELT